MLIYFSLLPDNPSVAARPARLSGGGDPAPNQPGPVSPGWNFARWDRTLRLVR
jgi:hypothetical protein